MPPPLRAKILPHLRNRKPRFEPDKEVATVPDGGRRRVRMALTVATMMFALFVIYPIIERTIQRENEAGSSEVTDCDRLAADPSDTQKLAVGVSREHLNIADARSACHKALTRTPDDGRTLYQLSRTYSAGGDAKLGLAYLRKSAAAGYAQGQFILGDALIHNGDSPSCEGGELLVRAARQRHFASKIALAVDWLNGTFTTCHLDVTESEITQLLTGAGDLADTPDEQHELAVVAARWSGR